MLALRHMSSRALLTLAIIVGTLAPLLVFAALARTPTETAFGEVNLWVLLPAAFLVGLLSFLSPCTLAILPAYFSYGVRSKQSSIVGLTVAFFCGLATTMTLVGATATALGQFLVQHLNSITVLGGIVIIVFGVLGVLGKGFSGLTIKERPSATKLGSYLFGATFALAWTTCLGPILGAVLTLLATQGIAVAQGAVLAFAYALGLGLPLIIVSAYFSRLGPGSGFWRVARGSGFRVQIGARTLELHTTNVLSGMALIFIGVLIATGQMHALMLEWANSEISQWVIEQEGQVRQLFGLP